MRIGIDFDNTIASYDKVFSEVAVEWGLLRKGVACTKQAVCRAIRQSPDGDVKWQRLQGRVYGKYMSRAEVMDGVLDFLKCCRAAKLEVVVVSHKTMYGHFDPDRIDLRDAAYRWLQDNGFFNEHCMGLDRDRVFFESTRVDKLRRIAALECGLFVDDLLEVLEDPSFPSGIRRCLFAPGGVGGEVRGIDVFRDWREITGAIFGG